MRNGSHQKASTLPNEVLPRDLGKRLRDWRSAVVDQTQEHPGRSLALAVGAGYLLGGGLFSALTGRLVATGVKLGLRLAVVPFVSHSVVSLVQGMVSGDGPANDLSTAEDVSPPKKTGSETTSNPKTVRRAENNKETHS